MSTWKRAILYISRKKGKTILLFLIFVVLISLVLTGMAVLGAADASAAQIRGSLGGYFTLAQDYSKMNTAQHVDDNMVQSVLKQDGIREYNVMDTFYMMTPNLALTPARFTLENDPKAQMARVLSNRESRLHEYFVLRILELSEGRHITPEDTGKTLVSNVMAEQNGIQVEDTITADYVDSYDGDGTVLKTFSFEVVGIFKEVSPTVAGQMTPECDLPANFIFVDENSGQTIKDVASSGKADWYNGGGTFFANDPKELDALTARIRDMPEIDFDSITLTVNNAAYEKSMEPLTRMEGMMGLMVTVIAVISIALLSLLLTVWARDRIHEAGILTSVGVHKREIFLQQLLEVLLVFFAAFAVAYVLTAFLSESIGGMLYQNASLSLAEAQSNASGIRSVNNSLDLSQVQPITTFVVHVTPVAAFMTCAFGALIAIASTLLSFITIWRRHPKDLLTMME